MAEKVKEHDFVKVNYTGKLADGTVFDTTEEKIAKENKLFSPKMNYSPATVCVGEKQVLPGLDEQFKGKEIGKEYAITLPPEKAFGRRDIKKMKIVPMGTFREHKINPQPGLQVDIDGEMGLITRVSGGRVIVNFNHPLAGKEVIYTFKILSTVTDTGEKVRSFLATMLRMPEENIEVIVSGETATVSLPVEFPVQISSILAQKLMQVTGLKDVLLQKGSETKNLPQNARAGQNR